MYTDECVYRYIFAICIIPCIFIHTQLDIVRNLVKQRLGAQWAWLLYVCKGTWSIASHRQPLIVQAQKQQGMPWSRVAAQTFSASAQLGFRDFLPNQVLMESGHVCCDPWCRSWCSCCCRALPTRLHTTRGGGVCCSYKVVRSANTKQFLNCDTFLSSWLGCGKKQVSLGDLAIQEYRQGHASRLLLGIQTSVFSTWVWNVGSRGHSCRDLGSEKTLCCRKVKHNKFGAIRHDLIDKNLDDLIFFFFRIRTIQILLRCSLQAFGVGEGKTESYEAGWC